MRQGEGGAGGGYQGGRRRAQVRHRGAPRQGSVLPPSRHRQGEWWRRGDAAPRGPGTGVAGGACRTVLELAGYKNCFAKQLGSSNPLNNARAVVKGLSEMRTYKQVAKERDMTVEELFAA